MKAQPGDDRIMLLTRITAVFVVPPVVLAFFFLYLAPEQSGQNFAWQIKPNLTAIYMGSGYLGGAYLFLHAAIGRRWHRVAAGFPAVAAFTAIMLVATLLHWSRFDPGHFPFQLWLILYAVTPLWVPWLWWRNRSADDGAPEPDEVAVPIRVRQMIRGLGVVIVLFALAGFLLPAFLIQIWPWSLTPLTARVLTGWLALLGIGCLVVAGDQRWSAWRVPVHSMAIWHLVFLLGTILYRQEFTAGRWLNWFNLSVMGLVLVVAGLQWGAVRARRQRVPG